MTRTNRVQPDGTFLAHPARGLFMGNRGILHAEDGQLGTARWRHPHWVCCVTRFRDRPPQPLNAAHRYTQLFFLDEAVAAAAGHRPCAQCRAAEFRQFQGFWHGAHGPATAPQIDRILHAARCGPGQRLRHHMALASHLPDGAFIRTDAGPALIAGSGLLPHTPAGYLPPVPRPSGVVTVLTSPPMLAVLAQGWKPVLHPTAQAD